MYRQYRHKTHLMIFWCHICEYETPESGGGMNARKTVYLEIVLSAPSCPKTIAALRHTKRPV